MAEPLASALAEMGMALLAVSRALGNPTPSQGLTLPTVHDTASVVEAINTFLVAKARAGKSDRYLRTMKNSLSKFARGRGSAPLASVTPADLEKWVLNNDWNGTTRRGYLRDVGTLFNFAMRRNIVTVNPARAVELPARADSKISLHSPQEVARVLMAARAFNVNVCRALAVRYFGGVRSSECDRITEELIRVERGFIEITVAVARKTRQRRLVKIHPVLTEWLKIGGTLPLANPGNRMSEFTAHLRSLTPPLAWSHNVTRHSFVSYHLAHFENAGKTALQAGHGETILFSNYRELVTPQDAEIFWGLTPERAEQICQT